MRNNITHLGSNNIRLKSFPCGSKAQLYTNSLRATDVNCIPCIDMYLAKNIRKKDSPKYLEWSARYEELKNDK